MSTEQKSQRKRERGAKWEEEENREKESRRNRQNKETDLGEAERVTKRERGRED